VSRPDRPKRPHDPAERGALLGVAVALAAVLLAGLFFGLQRGDRELGSNAVGVGAPVAEITPGQRLCINDVRPPAGTARLRLWLAAQRSGTRFDLETIARGGRRAVRRSLEVGAPGFHFLGLPPAGFAVTQTAVICLDVTAGRLAVGGSALDRYPGQRPATLDGAALSSGNEPAVHYYSAAGERPVRLAQLVDLFAHSAAYHGPLYPWLMLATLLAALGLSGWALWHLVTAPRRSVRRLAVVFALACFAWCFSWSVMAPPFQGNDESEHFANIEYLAKDAGMWDLSVQTNKNRPYSQHEALLMQAVHHNSLVVDGSARPFWNELSAPDLGARSARASRYDGGGVTAAGTAHGPAYYILFTPAYRLTNWMQPANQLVVLRVLNSLAAALVALFAVLSCALLLGGRRRHAIAVAGALIAFQPMFAYVSGAINNDTWVNLFGAVMLYLLLRLARKGWELRRELLVGVTAVVSVLGKMTGAANAIFAALVVALLMLRDRSLRSLRGGLTVLGAVVATAAGWLVLTTVVGWPRMLVYQHTDSLPPPAAWVPTLPQRIDYIIQQVFPFIELTGPMVGVSHAFERVYIVGGFGDYFWHRVAFPVPVFKVILAVLLTVFVTGAIGALRNRRWLRKNWAETAIVLLQPIVVYTLVEWAYATPGGRPVMAEQGRYIFPAITALAVIAAASGYGLPKKLRAPGWGALVGLAAGFTVVAWFFAAYHVYA
jgi:hypothetical protein